MRQTEALCRKLASAPFEEACVTWPFSTNGTGYGQAWFEGQRALAHRAICELVHGPAPTPDHEATHSCGRGHLACVNRWHLRWATPSANQMDRHKHGTMARGSHSHFAVLTESQALAIYRAQGTHTAIAAAYGVGRQTVTNIKLGESWAWLTGHRRAA